MFLIVCLILKKREKGVLGLADPCYLGFCSKATFVLSECVITHIKIDIYLYSYSGTNLKEDVNR